MTDQFLWFSGLNEQLQSGRKDTLKELYAIKLSFKLGKMPQKRMWCFRLLLEHLAWIDDQFLSGIRDSTKRRESVKDDEWCGRSKEVNTPELICQRVRCKVTLLRFSKRFLWKRPALFKSGQWLFHQDNTPVHNSILVTDYFTKIGIKTVPQPPYRPDLAPCDFWLFPNLRVMKQLGRWKRLWRRSLTRSHRKTSMGTSRSC